jgi:hypothetical protein
VTANRGSSQTTPHLPKAENQAKNWEKAQPSGYVGKPNHKNPYRALEPPKKTNVGSKKLVTPPRVERCLAGDPKL